MSELFGVEGGERYDGDAGLRMGRKPGHLCDVQAEVQVSVTACVWSLFGLSFPGSPQDLDVLRLPAPPPAPGTAWGPCSFGIMSPGFTVPEVLTRPWAMRGQPTLPKTCSWTDLQMHLPSSSHVNLEQRWSQKTTEKAGFTFPGTVKNVKPLLPPFPPIAGSQAHSVSCHSLHTRPTALPSSAGLKGAGYLSCFHRG